MTDLPYQNQHFLKKAKAEGVRQFIFLSTMSVYGFDNGVVTDKTAPKPVTDYGRSKLEAEYLLERSR